MDRSPPEEAFARGHARRLDDALVGAPRLDQLNVSVIENLDARTYRGAHFTTTPLGLGVGGAGGGAALAHARRCAKVGERPGR